MSCDIIPCNVMSCHRIGLSRRLKLTPQPCLHISQAAKRLNVDVHGLSAATNIEEDAHARFWEVAFEPSAAAAAAGAVPYNRNSHTGSVMRRFQRKHESTYLRNPTYKS